MNMLMSCPLVPISLSTCYVYKFLGNLLKTAEVAVQTFRVGTVTSTVVCNKGILVGKLNRYINVQVKKYFCVVQSYIYVRYR